MIADLHCDLLCYLKGGSKRTPYDLDARCSIPQLKQGGVKLQTMAIYSDTHPTSIEDGLAQAKIFSALPKEHPNEFAFAHLKNIEALPADKISILAAIENASAFSLETEPLAKSLERLNTFRKLCGNIFYISLTWNSENRFGGGAHAKAGLKEDGKQLIDFLHGKNIAIDLSHASDALVIDIFNYLDKKNYRMPILASHSNFRKIADVPRNLPEEFVKEIVRRDGLIGLNFIRSFVGEKDEINIVKQLEYGLKIGAQKHMCFGADFYYLQDIPVQYRKPEEQAFFPSFNHAGLYKTVIGLWKSHLQLSDNVLHDIGFGNFKRYLTSLSRDSL